MKHLTPSERIMAALRGVPTDTVPYQEVFFCHRAVAEHFAGPQNTMEDMARFIAESGQCSLLVGGFWWSPGSQLAETSTGRERYAGGRTYTMDQVLTMESPSIDESLPRLEEGIAAARKHGLATHVFVMSGFHSASSSMGLENLCYAAVDAPEILHAYISRIETFNREVLRRLHGRDIDFVFIDGDCAYKNGLMVSPCMFRDLWFEPTRRTVDFCRDNGWLYCYHTDGKIDEVVPLLIELGFSGIHGVEAAANDLADIKARFGDKITLFGNFDIVELARMTREQIRRKTRQMLRTGSRGGRYVAGCNTLPGDNILLENYLAFRDTIVEFRGNTTHSIRTS